MSQKKATIIGAGLVGSLQACYLQKRGYKTVGSPLLVSDLSIISSCMSEKL